MSFDLVERLAKDLDGEIKEAGALPDGSGFAVISFDLPQDHWLYAEHDNVPPMGLRCYDRKLRDALAKRIREAGKYALRVSTFNGKEDWDPDAVLQNLVVGLLGYWNSDGVSYKSSWNAELCQWITDDPPIPEEWANPAVIPPAVMFVETEDGAWLEDQDAE